MVECATAHPSLWWLLPDPVAPHFSVTPTPHRSTSLGRHLRSNAVLRLSGSSICGKHVPVQNDCHFWLFHPSVWLGSAVQKNRTATVCPEIAVCSDVGDALVLGFVGGATAAIALVQVCRAFPTKGSGGKRQKNDGRNLHCCKDTRIEGAAS